MCGSLPGQYIWQQIVDEVLHTLMLRGALQKKLEGFLVPAIIMNQTLQWRCHGKLSGKKKVQIFSSTAKELRRASKSVCVLGYPTIISVGVYKELEFSCHILVIHCRINRPIQDNLK